MFVKTYNISFDTDGGVEVSNIKVVEGQKVILPTDVFKECFIFRGWVDENNNNIKEIIVTKDINLKATWQEVKTPNQEDSKQETENKAEQTVKVDTTKKVYYCPNGYTLSGTKCLKTTTVEAVLTNETCPEGYNKMTSESKCIATSYSAISKTKCPSGYPYKSEEPGYSNRCYTQIKSATYQNSCEGRYYNGYCYYGDMKYHINYCDNDSDYKLIINYSDNKYYCYKIIDITRTYECDNGYTLNGTKCLKTETINASVK